MLKKEEPDSQAAESESKGSESEPERADSVSLVDLFDQLDRNAFRRALELRDSVYPLYNQR